MFTKQRSRLKEILKSINPYEPCIFEFLLGHAAYFCRRSTKVTLRSVMVMVMVMVMMMMMMMMMMVMKNMNKIKNRKGDYTGKNQRQLKAAKGSLLSLRKC